MAKGDFESRSYPIVDYASMKFLMTNWGWDKALGILENYSDFESILQISQEEFEKRCNQYYQDDLLYR